MPNQNEFHVDPLLTEMSVAYQNMELIGTQLMPIFEVAKKSGIYYKFDKANFRIEDSRRSGVTRANRVDYGLTKVNYGPLAEHALEEAIEWDVRDNYPTPMDAYTDATNNLTAKIDLGLEKEIATMLTDSAVLTQYQALSGSNRWDDYANSDVIGNVKTAKDTIQLNGMVTANTIALGYEVWSVVSVHPDLLGRLSVASVRVLTTELFAALVGVEKVLIGKAIENTAVEGQADSMGYVWGKNVIVAYVTPKPGLKQVTLGFTLRLKDGRMVDRYTETGVKADFVRVTDYELPVVVALEAGYLYKTVIS